MTQHTILIADDSSSVRSILKVYLNPLRAEVLEADTGERALRLAKLMPLSLMISDINMPGMDGLTLVEQVRRDTRPSVAGVPVILLTSDKSAAAQARMREVGADELLYKPISADALVAIATRYLNKA